MCRGTCTGKQDLHRVTGELEKTMESKVLLGEEVRSLNAQYYGRRSTQSTDAAAQNPDGKICLSVSDIAVLARRYN
jgi:hypothetical protein